MCAYAAKVEQGGCEPGTPQCPPPLLVYVFATIRLLMLQRERKFSCVQRSFHTTKR